MTRRLPPVALALAVLAGCAPALTAAPETGAAEASGPGELVGVTAEALLERVREGGAAVTMVNVWSTWCDPCIEELPDLVRLRSDYRERGFELYLVSADFTERGQEVREFLAGEGIRFRTYHKQQGDGAFIEAMHPEWSGTLPATFVYDSSGKLRTFWEGAASYEELARAVEAAYLPEGTTERR
jgi:thiol-disulfide isomerase/thioredoxin